MMVVIAYDISSNENGKKRLSKISKECEKYGQRIQNSVFELLLTPSQFEILKNYIIKNINPTYDSIRIYYLGSNWENRVEHIGSKEPYNPEGVLIF